ncbi:uncharacterized protein KY384_004708 [Bacidia gigantensis]|uniref:uncharacterized protein n=1 Tax=Bacidia gigantensis TaxID=2732470 RepID=UPI001D04223E|nr:uncharacterized protein KY384_004708 [Bacidia gigantensis]KAG8530208.1 hypothetical protein KY384_004708 [Bacidia gigantensis]
MAALDRLPPELTNKIVNLLKRSDTESQTHLRNLRLVNRALSVVATPFVFATVPLWIGMHSLKNLNNIAQHPLLSKLVTKIAFEPLRAIETYDEGELQKSVKDYFDYQNSSLNDSTIAVGQYLAARKRYANEQQFLDRDDTDRRILTLEYRSTRFEYWRKKMLVL